MKVSNALKGLVVTGSIIGGLALSLGTAFAGSTGYHWNPQSTPEAVSVPSGGAVTFTDNKGNWVKCTSTAGTYAESPWNNDTSFAQTTDVHGNTAAPSFSSCTSNLGSASVSCSNSWHMKAVNTTTVDVSNVACDITISSFIGSCTIHSGTSTSPISVTGNTWNNRTSQLTANSNQSFAISETGTICDGATSATESGTVQVGSSGSVTIVAD